MAQVRTEFVKKKWREAEAQGSDAVRLLERGRPATRGQPAVEPFETVEEATAAEEAAYAKTNAGAKQRQRDRATAASRKAEDDVAKLQGAATNGSAREKRAAGHVARDAEGVPGLISRGLPG